MLKVREHTPNLAPFTRFKIGPFTRIQISRHTFRMLICNFCVHIHLTVSFSCFLSISIHSTHLRPTCLFAANCIFPLFTISDGTGFIVWIKYAGGRCKFFSIPHYPFFVCLNCVCRQLVKNCTSFVLLSAQNLCFIQYFFFVFSFCCR